MKPSPDDDKTTWGDDGSPEQLATADRLLRAARAYHPPVRVTLAQVQTAARGQRRLGAGLSARLVVAGAFGLCALLVMGGVALSRGWLGWRPRATAPTTISVPAATTRVERRGRLRTALRAPGAVEIGGAGNEGSLPREEPALAPTAPAPPAPVIAPAPAAASTAAPTPAPAIVAHPVAPHLSVSERPARPGGTTEVTQLRDALARLRTARDPGGALALLDEYDRRFPGGFLREEAAATRIEALLAAGQSTEALQQLETIPAALLDRWPRLRIARGELRANHGRCDDALTDFAGLLAQPTGDEIERRANRGRAACLRLPAK